MYPLSSGYTTGIWDWITESNINSSIDELIRRKHDYKKCNLAVLALSWLAGMDPGRVRTRKHSRRYRDYRHDDKSDHEREDNGNVKDQQTPGQGTYKHGRH